MYCIYWARSGLGAELDGRQVARKERTIADRSIGVDNLFLYFLLRHKGQASQVRGKGALSYRALPPLSRTREPSQPFEPLGMDDGKIRFLFS